MDAKDAILEEFSNVSPILVNWDEMIEELG